MAGPNTLHPAGQWCIFISHSVTDIRICRAGPAVQPKIVRVVYVHPSSSRGRSTSRQWGGGESSYYS
uniref:Uncharacterized protein n=1 Tax=Anguilla anguilla TaxID=7936 RepID=A0A0E9WP52_ANGAN